MKSLKFTPRLAEMTLAGKKTSTLRLFDDKNMQTGDDLELINRDTSEVFAKAVITLAYEKALGQITDEDLVGNEPFESEEQMYEVFRSYYGDRVGPESIAKIIRYKLID